MCFNEIILFIKEGIRMNKNTVLESNGLSVMEFIEKLLTENIEKEIILNSISFNYANSMSYIHDWRTKYRKIRIKEKYKTLKTSDLAKEEIFRRISYELEKEFLEKNIDVNMTPRVVRHAIESA